MYRKVRYFRNFSNTGKHNDVGFAKLFNTLKSISLYTTCLKIKDTAFGLWCLWASYD